MHMPLPTATTEPRFLHLDNGQVAFDYPEGMQLYAAGDPAFVTYPIQLGGELVADVADPHFIYSGKVVARFIALFRQPLPSGSNVEQVMQKAYGEQLIQKGVLNADGPVTLAGLPAVQKTYRVYSGEPAYDMRDIWFGVNGQIYRLSIWTQFTNTEDFRAFQSTADALIESLLSASSAVRCGKNDRATGGFDAGRAFRKWTTALCVSSCWKMARQCTTPFSTEISRSEPCVSSTLPIPIPRW